MKTLNLITLVLAFAFFTSAGAYSQNDSTRSKEKLRKVVKEKLIEKLNIDEATANKLIELAAENRKNLKDLNRKRKELTDYIFDNPQSSDISTKLEDLMDTENKVNQANNDYYSKLKSFLSPNQIALSMVFQRDLMKFMKKEMKKKKDNKRNDDGGLF